MMLAPLRTPCGVREIRMDREAGASALIFSDAASGPRSSVRGEASAPSFTPDR
ncbi:hypothetical protein A33K_17745 [Burkholderia humptydooensis MSMB43]|uniref:Uncharacterized protein n=1 Tax=Burkholderia humptydooensis MSMB43 TaxID=441157 RepID=A0ABN0G0C8_9BURK|nr:hypothetical protein A33K_17745 [Burkholderia humptydooensis MSMB43]